MVHELDTFDRKMDWGFNKFYIYLF